MKLFDLYAELTLDSAKFDKGVSKASKQGQALSSSIKSGLGGATTFINNRVSATTIALGNLMADATKQGAALAKQLATVGLDYNAQMETYVTNFRTMLGGSAEEAEKLTSNLEDMAAATPFAMTDLADATQVLLQFGQDSSTVLDTLQTLGDISMGDANKLNSLTLAFAQASSSGKLMGQDLMQMVNAGFNPLQTIVEKTGVSMGDLKDFMSDGKATGALKRSMREAQREVRNMGDEASEGAKMLAQMAEEGSISADLLGRIFEIETSPGGRFYGAMEAASKTYSGMISTLEDDSTALMGKVFKPLSDFMTEDILPSAIELISTMDKAYDIGGLEASVSAGTDFIGDKLAEWGPMALDAGAALMANLASGITGDEVSKDEVSTFLSTLFDDGQTAIEKVEETAGGLLAGIYDGLTADSDSKEGIIAEISGIWGEGVASMIDLTDAAGGLLGTIYTKISGQEATAENIGRTIGGVFSAGGDAMTSLRQTAAELFRDLDDALKDDPQSATQIADTISGVFAAGGAGMNNIVQTAGSLFSDVYAAITKDTSGAAKLENLFTDLGGTAEKGVSVIGEFFGGIAQGYSVLGKEVANLDPSSPLGKMVDFVSNGMAAIEEQGKVIAEQREAQKQINLSGWLGENANTGSQVSWGTVAAAALLTGHPIISGYSALTSLIIPPEVEYYDPTQDPTWDAYMAQKAEEAANPLGYTQDEIQNALEEITNGEPVSIPVSLTGPNGEEVLPWDFPSFETAEGTEISFEPLAAEVSGLAEAAQAAADAAKSAAEAAVAAASAMAGAKISLDGVTVGELILPTVSAGLYREINAIHKQK